MKVGCRHRHGFILRDIILSFFLFLICLVQRVQFQPVFNDLEHDLGNFDGVAYSLDDSHNDRTGYRKCRDN